MNAGYRRTHENRENVCKQIKSVYIHRYKYIYIYIYLHIHILDGPLRAHCGGRSGDSALTFPPSPHPTHPGAEI
jgi:hypothetical protein